MRLQWTDSYELARALIEKYPTKDPITVRFTDLYQWILGLDNFEDDPNRCSEIILQAVQQAWINEC